MIVISQPTYLPWVGYFSLINEAKTFIFLDDVQFNSRSWQQRNRVLNNDMVKYLTIPVKKKGKKDQLICNTSIDDKTIFQQHIKMINHFYSKSKFFNEYFNFFEKILSECEKYNYLSEVNAFLIEKISELLKLDYNFNLSSKISSTGYKSDKLISICKSLNQEKYLTNEGAMIYLNKDLDKFKKNKVDLYKIIFEEIKYNQLSKSFKGNLSIVDVLFNEGPNTVDIIRNSYKIKKIL